MNHIVRFGLILKSDEKSITYRDSLVADFQNNKLTLYNADGSVERFLASDIKQIRAGFAKTSPGRCMSKFVVREENEQK